MKNEMSLKINAKAEEGIPFELRPKMSLVGVDGNAFSIIAAVSRCLRRAGLLDYVEKYKKEATAGDYQNLLRVSQLYVRD